MRFPQQALFHAGLTILLLAGKVRFSQDTRKWGILKTIKKSGDPPWALKRVQYPLS